MLDPPPALADGRTCRAATSPRRSSGHAPARGSCWRSASLPSIVVFFAYNQVRFGSPWESGYGLATLPPFLEAQRQIGLFALAHIPMNLDYFLFHMPTIISSFPFFKPDGLGLSVLLTSPGLLFAFQADWRRPRAWWLAGAAIAVADPDPALLRRRLAPVRLPLLPRLGPVRDGPVRARRGATRTGRTGLDRAHRLRNGGRGDRRVLGLSPLMRHDRWPVMMRAMSSRKTLRRAS